MPLDPGDRPVTRLDLLLALVVAPATVLILNMEAIFPPPHPLGRLTSGPRKFIVLFVFGLVAAVIARRVERWQERRKERRRQSEAEGTGPTAD